MTPSRSSVIAHFFGGPRDGESEALEAAPFKLIVPQLGELQWRGGDVVDEMVPVREIVYQRRGPVLEGHAYYDWIDR